MTQPHKNTTHKNTAHQKHSTPKTQHTKTQHTKAQHTKNTAHKKHSTPKSFWYLTGKSQFPCNRISQRTFHHRITNGYNIIGNVTAPETPHSKQVSSERLF